MTLQIKAFPVDKETSIIVSTSNTVGPIITIVEPEKSLVVAGNDKLTVLRDAIDYALGNQD